MKKTLSVLFLTLCTALMLSGYASIVSSLPQLIAAAVIAIAAVAGVWWRRAKKKVSKTLGIDENRNKEVESDVLEIRDDAKSDFDKRVAKSDFDKRARDKRVR